MRRMNVGMQNWQIGRMLAGTRVNSEMFDISAHLDPTLHLNENIRNIQRMHGIQTRNFGMEAIEQNKQEQKRERIRRQDPNRMTGYQGAHGLMIDAQLQAMRPGKRFSRYGHRYYERRGNRADRGKLL